MSITFKEVQDRARSFDSSTYAGVTFVQAWYCVPVDRSVKWVPQHCLCSSTNLARKVLSEWFVLCADESIRADFERSVVNPRARVKLFVIKEVTLRSALELALQSIPENCKQERRVLRDLLDQKSERYGTLTNECEVALYG